MMDGEKGDRFCSLAANLILIMSNSDEVYSWCSSHLLGKENKCNGCKLSKAKTWYQAFFLADVKQAYSSRKIQLVSDVFSER